MASPTTLTPPPVLDQRLLEPRRHHWRGWLAAVAVIATVTVFAGSRSTGTGCSPWHGPMSGESDQVVGVTATVDTQVGDRVSYASMWVYEPLAGRRHAGLRRSGGRGRRAPGRRRMAPRGSSDLPASGGSMEGRRSRLLQGPTRGLRGPVAHADRERTSRGGEASPHAPRHVHIAGVQREVRVGPMHYTTTFADGFVLHAS